MTSLELYSWQRRDVDHLAAHNYTGLIATQAGGGKSIVAATALVESGAQTTLLIAPKSTHATAWAPTLQNNFGLEPRVIGNGNKAERAATFDFVLGVPGVYMATPQWVTRTDTSDWSGDMLLFDEIHMAGAITPKKALQRKLTGFYPAEQKTALAGRFGMRLALSATPMRSDFANMWGVTRFTNPEFSGRGQVADANHWHWKTDRMTSKEIVTGVEWFPCSPEQYRNPPEGAWKKIIDGVPHLGKPTKVKQYIAEAEPGLLLSQMPCFVMHKRREYCCEDHPQGFLPTDEPQIIEREVILTAKQRKNIEQMNDLMMTYIGDEPLVATISLTQKQRVRQLAMAEATVEVYDEDKTRVVFAEGAKSPVIDEIAHILDNLPEGEPVVVYSESQRFAELITAQLNKAGFKAEEYSGVRKADLAQFGAEYQVLVGVMAAIGTGTNGLQDRCSTEIYADQPVSLTMRTQASARLDRMDSARQVQRFVITDDLGVQKGRLESLWTQQILVGRSLRVTEI